MKILIISRASIWMIFQNSVTFFSLPQEKEKDEADFINTLTHSDFISKCTNYIII